MPPYMSFRFGIVERHCDHIAIKGLSMAGAFSFFISSFLAFFFHFLFFLSLFLPLFPHSYALFSSTFSSFLGSVFSPVGLCNC